MLELGNRPTNRLNRQGPATHFATLRAFGHFTVAGVGCLLLSDDLEVEVSFAGMDLKDGFLWIQAGSVAGPFSLEGSIPAAVAGVSATYPQ